MIKVTLFCSIILAASIGQIFLKKAVTTSDGIGFGLLINPCFVIGVLLYAFCSIAWLWVIKVTPLSHAYPMLALTFVLVPLFSIVFLGEQIYIVTLIGMFLILIGVFLVARQF